MEKKGGRGGEIGTHWGQLQFLKKILFNIFFPFKMFIMWKLLTEKKKIIGE